MIGLLARKRTNVTALAVMIALIAAMFVALQSAGAQTRPCTANPGIMLGFGETCTIDLSELDEGATAASVDIPTEGGATGTTAPVVSGVATITASTTAGVATVTITKPDGDATDGETNNPGTDRDETTSDDVTSFDVTVVGFGIESVAIVGDNDNVVSAGRSVTARAKLRSQSSSAVVTLTVPTTGLSIASTTTAGETTQSRRHAQDSDAMYDFTVNTAGAPAGDYVLTFVADNDPGTDDVAGSRNEAEKSATATLTLTIGDPGAGLSSATLSLGNETNDKPYTDKDETVAEDGSEPASGGDVNLVIQAFDSLGGKSNSSAVDQIIIIAPGGTIASTHLTGADDTATVADGSSSLTLNENDASPGSGATPDVGQRTVVTLSKADSKPGQVTVYAIVSGPGGAATTESITLNFTGDAASMSIADATETLLSSEDGAEITLVVTAEDAGGNSTPPPTNGVSIVITDPNGKRQGTGVIGRSPVTKAGAKYVITLTGNGTSDAPLAAGVWTLTASKGKLSATATFAVAGDAAKVAVSVDNATPSDGDEFVTVTATVTDKDDNSVADGTPVRFAASGNDTILFNTDSDDVATTKGGEASAVFVVVGPGRSVVSAIAGAGRDAEVVVSTAGDAGTDAMADEEVGLDCLTRLSGLTVYDCSTGSSASEIFTLVASRGATALHLWNGADWVRYSVVDGNEVPGSLDFDITDNDPLWISN